MLLLWILFNLVYFLNGGGDPQRYFGIAMPFLFILVAKFISTFKWKKREILVAGIIFFSICVFFRIHDYQFYTYFVYRNNLSTLMIWSLPFLFLLTSLVKNFREETISILIGAYLGFSLYFILFPSATWPIANSLATRYVSQSNEKIIVSKSWYVLESSLYYDWKEDKKVDKSYFMIPLSDVKKFDKENKENCQKKVVGGYPLVFLCSKIS